MKLFESCLLALVLASCAGVQEKIDSVQEKVQARVACVAEVLKPYEKYFTSEMVEAALAGKLDPIETLKAVEVSPAEVAAVSKQLKACTK